VTTFEGEPVGADRRIALVAAKFNKVVTANLVDGALAGLTDLGVDPDRIDLAWVPGAFEIPSVARRMASSGLYDAIICLGAVIRGETAHFELVAGEAARGVAAVSADTGIPVIFEVLATDDLAQAQARAGGAQGNKGRDAAAVALEMADLVSRLPGTER
jgi:6,7-dimethyl-8-ribityllumazine synthase